MQEESKTSTPITDDNTIILEKGVKILDCDEAGYVPVNVSRNIENELGMAKSLFKYFKNRFTEVQNETFELDLQVSQQRKKTKKYAWLAFLNGIGLIGAAFPLASNGHGLFALFLLALAATTISFFDDRDE